MKKPSKTGAAIAAPALSSQNESSKLPIFPASVTPKPRNSRRVHQAKIGSISIPLTEEENRALIARLNQHTEKHGVKFGFFASLLGETANYVSPGL